MNAITRTTSDKATGDRKQETGDAGDPSACILSPVSCSLRPLPEPRVALSFRVATMADLPFIDALQKANSKGLGYFPTAQLTGYIEGGHVLLAEQVTGDSILDTGGESSSAPSIKHPVSSIRRLGYCISRDRYLKRDELGVIYQLCVVAGEQRKLVGATLVQEIFKRSAYGCRLYCLWCAQDLPANHFWESLGFVPIAFRAGSDKKKRVHIFWQKRIDEASITTHQSPYWYPFKTESGAIRADRLVFPIPPGTHWSEVRAVAVPEVESAEAKRLGSAVKTPKHAEGAAKAQMSVTRVPVRGTVVGRSANSRSGLHFTPPMHSAPAAPVRQPKTARAAKPKAAKIDPKFLAANRELRDRYLEQLNTHDIAGCGKYEVSRALPQAGKKSAPLLEAA